MPTPIFTVKNPELSRWMSTVEKFLKSKNPNLSIGEIRRLPMMQGCWEHVRLAMKNEIPTKPEESNASMDSITFNAYASHYFLKLIKNMPINPNTTPTLVLETAEIDDDWDFSTGDTMGWAICGTEYYAEVWATQQYYNDVLHQPISESEVVEMLLQYRDYEETGKGDINFGVIDWVLPDDAKVIIIGDWGTSNEDAYEMLKKLVDTYNPDCIIHLGDIYYSGSGSECDDNFYNVIRDQIGTNIPVFTIPGNHEYYSFGAGFYRLIDKMNVNIPISNAQQEASYFCLRTASNKWQFLGLDTGYNDHSPVGTALSPPAPNLRSYNDYSWAADKLNHFSGQTIMLSHHQLFSHSSGMHSADYGDNFANPYLYKYFLPYFKSRISTWFWGHEHSFAVYKDGIFGLNKGRLLGSSSYEETSDDGPYSKAYSLVPYDPSNVLIGTNSYPSTGNDSEKYYPHVGAVLQFNGSSNPTIEYLSFPSWEDGHSPASSYKVLTPILSETLTPAAAYPGGMWSGNHKVKDSNGGTDKSPGLAFLDDTIYMTYKNVDDNDHIWWDAPSYSPSSGKFTASNPQMISGDNHSNNTDSDIPASASTPSIVAYDGKVYLVYRGSGKTNIRWCVFDPDTQIWTKYGKISDFISGSPSVKSNHAPKLTVFNGMLYMIYLSSDDDVTVYTATYTTSNGWTLHHDHDVTTGSITRPAFSANEICPAPCANDTHLYLLYSTNDYSMGLIQGDLNNNWVDLGLVANNKFHSSSSISGYTINKDYITYLPKTSQGMSVVADNNYIRMAYRGHNDNHTIYWAVYDIYAGLWSGGLPIVNVNNYEKMNTSDFPGLCMGDAYTFMAFPGDSSTHIWTAIQENY